MTAPAQPSYPHVIRVHDSEAKTSLAYVRIDSEDLAAPAVRLQKAVRLLNTLIERIDLADGQQKVAVVVSREFVQAARRIIEVEESSR